MSTGNIKTIVDGKDFGFIAPDGQKPGDKDLFFHKESLVDVTLEELKAGDKVSFDVEAAEKGPRAVNVKRA
ncbi:MAG: cold shock domain-containing protein [Candidatus Yanofskybacteria bacterium]|nr:cold shock domain-containing protein [Candidatus Yanofskybacteria bacterium]